MQLEIDLLEHGRPSGGERTTPGVDRCPDGLQVLVADDDPEIRSYVRRCLDHEDGTTHVIEAADGVQALEAVRGGGVDLVLTDIVMSRLDGFALYHALRNDATHRNLPIVLMAGEHSYGEIETALGDPRRRLAILAKPFNCEGLCRAIHRLLGSD